MHRWRGVGRAWKGCSRPITSCTRRRCPSDTRFMRQPGFTSKTWMASAARRGVREPTSPNPARQHETAGRPPSETVHDDLVVPPLLI